MSPRRDVAKPRIDVYVRKNDNAIAGRVMEAKSGPRIVGTFLAKRAAPQRVSFQWDGARCSGEMTGRVFLATPEPAPPGMILIGERKIFFEVQPEYGQTLWLRADLIGAQSWVSGRER